MSKLTTINAEANDNWDDLFSGLDPVDEFEVKRDEIAAELAALLSYSGKSRSCIANELSWPKSRVSKVLSGESNLTLQTIWEFVTKLDYEFDVVYRKPKASRPSQPWYELATCHTSNAIVNNKSLYILHLQSASEVARDFKHGVQKKVYMSVIADEDMRHSVDSLSVAVASRDMLSQDSMMFKIDLGKRKNPVEVLNIKGDSNGG